MSYWKAMGYVVYVAAAGKAVVRYLGDKDEERLAGSIATVLYGALDDILKGKASNSVDKDKVIEAAKAVAVVIEDAAN